MKPRAPEKANAHRQPHSMATHGIMTAARAPPTLEPLSKMATAILRSWLGNHSATVLPAPGQLKPSPMPSRKRKAANPVTGGTFEDLIFVKTIDTNGNESPVPIGRNPNFRNTSGRYAPLFARIGFRLTF